jgi:hypothetical protein
MAAVLSLGGVLQDRGDVGVGSRHPGGLIGWKFHGSGQGLSGRGFDHLYKFKPVNSSGAMPRSESGHLPPPNLLAGGVKVDGRFHPAQSTWVNREGGDLLLLLPLANRTIQW